jgi:flavin reductase (DIM6/NTAB) family NADH-FMN oxidoreductase RutF
MPAYPPGARPPAFDTVQFRQALSQFATGVTVITGRMHDASMFGVTISSFNSLSLQPPLVLWSLAHTASTMQAFATSRAYVINVLSSDQVDLAYHFARPGAARFDSLPFTLSERGLPVLGGTVAWFECHHRSRHAEGDHAIFVGEVERCHSRPNRTLGFHRGQFIAI